ncbi:MAG TPA: succinate dehydrogenase cytochrome b subunit [Acidimicrobiia bacterium]
MTATESRPASTRRRAPWIVELYRTDVGKKYAMAVSGVLGLMFLVAHMVGNLHAFEGMEQLNAYGEGLRDIGEPLFPRTLILWVFLRIPLILALVVHVHAAWALTRTNQRARGSERYTGERDYLAANYASRTMRWSGVIVLLFLAWHLADLTWGVSAVNPGFERGDVYGNLVASLERWWVALIYVVAQAALALHVWHGAWSMFQSLGINNERFNRFRRTLATALTILIIAGFVAIPVAVQIGVMT